MNTQAPRPKTRPVATPRAHALMLLHEMFDKRLTLDEAVSRAPFVGSEADRSFALLLVRAVLQHVGQLDALIMRYLDKPLPKKRLAVTVALRLGAAQLLVLGTPAHAAVNETVTLIKRGKDAGLAGLVNAVLQRMARERPALPAATANLPVWLRTRWEASYGEMAVARMAEVASQRPPLDITRRDGSSERLAVDHPPIEQLEGYDDGAFFVQDVAASVPARMLGDVRGKAVLDVCAAPGGKAMQLALAGADVTALDRSEPRLRRLRENMARMKLEVEVIAADAMQWQAPRQYDAILLDAPCTATGTWRRHPEVVHLVGPADIEEMAAVQRRLLIKAWGWLKPGGTLVYCVCSLEPEEGEQQAQWFIGQVADAEIVAAPQASMPQAISAEGYVRTRPDMMHEQGGMDGFFAVCWQKAQIKNL